MRGFFYYLMIALIVWLLLFILVELKIIYNKKKKVKDSYNNLLMTYDKYIKMMNDAIKYIKSYSVWDAKSLEKDLNSLLNGDDVFSDSSLNKVRIIIKKIELFDEVFEELKNNKKYEKIKKELKKFDTRINGLVKEYNLNIERYNKKNSSFPTSFVSLIFKIESFNMIILKF